MLGIFKLFIFIIFATCCAHGHGHSHDSGHGHSHDNDFHEHHDHDHHHHEPAHYKYSREANEVNPTKSSRHSGETPDSASAYMKTVASDEDDVYEFDSNGFFSFMNHAKYRIWVYSLGSTVLISAAPFFILFLIPISSAGSSHGSPLLKVLLGFAAGGLLGDAVLHLIPHAIMAQQAKDASSDSAAHGHHSHNSPGSHHHGHSHGHGSAHDMSVFLYVLCGVFAFLAIDKMVRILKGGGGHSHSHDPLPKPNRRRISDNDSSANHKRSDSSDDAGPTESGTELRHRSNGPAGSVPRLNSTSKDRSGRHEQTDNERDGDGGIQVAGYLNLAADFAHNFTDGLAIGASFMAGNAIGLTTTVTVLLHEIPHEIGDFAILIQSGCSKRSAIFLQLLTAFGALLGCCVSLLASDPGAVAQAAEASWILPFTAGGFIYVALVSVIPELLVNSNFWQSIKELIALFIGIGMMVLIAEFE